MIQRIQSLWIFAAVCCLVVALMVPVAQCRFQLGSGQPAQGTFGLMPQADAGGTADWQNLSPDGNPDQLMTFAQRPTDVAVWPLWLLGGLSALVALVGLFLFGRRMLQVRVMLVSFLLAVAYMLALLFWGIDAFRDSLLARMPNSMDMHTVWLAGAYLPLAAIVFLILAIRAIRADEARVRAADRLR